MGAMPPVHSTVSAPAARQGTALVVAILSVEAVVIVAAAVLYGGGRDLWGFALVGLLCAFISHLPFLLAGVELFSLWGAVSLVVTVGAGLRGLAIATGYPDPTSIDRLFLLGRTFESLWAEAWLTVAGVAAVTLGFVLGQQGSVRERSSGRRSWRLDTAVVPAGSVHLAISVYAVLGASFAYLYYRAVGGESATISERRTTYTGAAGYESHGLTEFLAHASVVALLLYLGLRLNDRRPLTLSNWCLVGLLGANAFAINWVTTTRADLLYVTFGALALVSLVRQRLSFRVITGVGLLILLGIGALSAARSADGDASSGLSLRFAFDSGLMNRNAFDLSKTMHITDAVPETLPYADGQTILNYALAPVPRSLWPDKPVVSPGPVIGSTIYGLKQTGVPPGLVAELVWNFGRSAALALCVVMGLILGVIQRRARAIPTTSLVGLVVFAYVVIPFGKAAMGVAIGQAVSQALQGLVLLAPLALYSALVSRARRPRRSGATGRRRVPARA